jgi:hypothetical protein
MCAQALGQRLQDVHKIYVDAFGTGDDAEVIRSKVIAQLVKSGRFEVVQSQDMADAVLTGAGQVTSSQYSGASSIGGTVSARSGTMYQATAGVRIAGKDQKILWADDATGRGSSARAGSTLADKIVKDLLKEVLKKDRGK